MDTEYKIIGGDGVEYGPAPLTELRSWIRDGRVAAMTKVWRSDLLSWSPADRYTELHDDLERLSASVAIAAGFWARLAAFLIDHFLLMVVFYAIWNLLSGALKWQMPEPPQVLTPASLQQYYQQFSLWWFNRGVPIFYPIFLIYDVLLNGRFGATVGKMAIGAKITMLDGSPIGYNRALLRWMAARLSEIMFFSGYLLIALRRDKRALHDLLVGTRVVFKR